MNFEIGDFVLQVDLLFSAGVSSGLRRMLTCLFTGFGAEQSYAVALLERYAGRRPDAVQFALEDRVLPLRSRDEVGIDISFAAMPFEEDAINRATYYEYGPRINLRTCSAEDLLVMKGFAARPRDWVDVRSFLERQGAFLKRRAVLKRLKLLADLKEDPHIMLTMREICFARFRAGD